MREEIIRVPLIIGTQCFLAFITLVSLYFIAAAIGPLLGYISIISTIIFTRKFYHKPSALVFILWLIAGYPLCSSVWIANPIYFLHPFAQLAALVIYVFVAAVCGWGVYILWIEITDPNWPSPRQAVLRDGPYIPLITTETYGGQVLPEISTIPNLPSRTITVQLDKTGNGSHTESVAHIPDQENWRKFAWAVAHHGKGFTEATARAYNVPLADVRDQAGQLIVIGMRTLREQFLRRGWLEWKNPAVHERGLRVTTKGQVVLEAIGKNEKDD
jgi:hypothetical protein